jgi:hypothetical protein
VKKNQNHKLILITFHRPANKQSPVLAVMPTGAGRIDVHVPRMGRTGRVPRCRNSIGRVARTHGAAMRVVGDPVYSMGRAPSAGLSSSCVGNTGVGRGRGVYDEYVLIACNAAFDRACGS